MKLPLLLAFLLFFSSVTTARAYYARLSPFTSISVPLSFSGNLVPVPDNRTYDISLQGPPEVLAALSASVSGNALTLGLTSTNLSPDLIAETNFTVRMPQGTLESLSTGGNGTFEANGRVATRGSLSVTASGGGYTSIVEVLSSTAVIRSSGSGILIVGGDNLAGVQYTASGGRGFISGVYSQAVVSLTGETDLYVEAGRDTLQITGLVAGPGKVYYQGGACFVRGFLDSPCTPGTVRLP